jgi:hypothetical protein
MKISNINDPFTLFSLSGKAHAKQRKRNAFASLSTSLSTSLKNPIAFSVMWAQPFDFGLAHNLPLKRRKDFKNVWYEAAHRGAQPGISQASVPYRGRPRFKRIGAAAGSVYLTKRRIYYTDTKLSYISTITTRIK